jgi:tRNA(Ser,Leu) C12 N-acetylase TAN1
MHDWNVVVTTYSDGFRLANAVLAEFGAVAPTDYYNVLVMRVDDVRAFLDSFGARYAADAEIGNAVSRVVPAQNSFDFDGPDAFEDSARTVAYGWLKRLAGKGFHVRMHRRGFKGRLSTQREEQFLDAVLLGALDSLGNPGRITFDRADLVIDIETVDDRAGMSLWTRAELEACPFLNPD